MGWVPCGWDVEGGAFRVTQRTATVQVGKRVTNGTISVTKVGRNAMFHPKRAVMKIAATTSTTSLSGEVIPGRKSGNTVIWRRSMPAATNRPILRRARQSSRLNGARGFFMGTPGAYGKYYRKVDG